MNQFHNRIPRNEEIKAKWLQNIAEYQELENVTSHTALCSLHFSPGCFANEDELMSDAAPTIFPIRNLYEQSGIIKQFIRIFLSFIYYSSF